MFRKLWVVCDEVRSGAHIDQFKDYILAVLFFRFASIKFGLDYEAAKKTSPENLGAEVFTPLRWRFGLPEGFFPDFTSKVLGSAKARAVTAQKLFDAFGQLDEPGLLGDAFEYLMDMFSAGRSKSKGQYFTPPELSGLLISLLEVEEGSSLYDPTCGTGALLLKAGGAVPYGQEKDFEAARIAKLNFILHGFDHENIKVGDTLSEPQHDQVFDYVVANPPFSDSTWSNGMASFEMFDIWDGLQPPSSKGDYAWLAHVINKMERRAAVILPLGVLYRGNSEGALREKLVASRLLKGVIELPSKLFWGTDIPAVILILDREDTSEGIFFIQAREYFGMRDKRAILRQGDLRRILDTWKSRKDVKQYARLVTYEEIEDGNLNVNRYIDLYVPKKPVNLRGLHVGATSVKELEFLSPFEGLAETLYEPYDLGYVRLTVSAENDWELKRALHEIIAQNPSFISFKEKTLEAYHRWKDGDERAFKGLPYFDEYLLNPEEGPDYEANMLKEVEAQIERVAQRLVDEISRLQENYGEGLITLRENTARAMREMDKILSELGLIW